MSKVTVLLLFSVFSILAQSSESKNIKDSVVTSSPEAPQPSRWYYGGIVGFSFWQDYFSFSVEPLIGYKISEKFSVGGKLQYSYISDSRNEFQDFTYNNYGASVFARFRPITKMYLHSEFVYANFDSYSFNLSNLKWESDRVWVPFLLLGAGFVQPVSANVSLYAEVLFDVLQDDNSPYEEWDPIIHIGAGVGF